MSAVLSLAQILAADDLPVREVEVPEWGGAVRLRMLSAAERDALSAAIIGIEDSVARVAAMRRALLMAGMVDPAGKPLLDDAAYTAVLGKSGPAVDAVFKAALDLNGMSPTAREAAKNA